MEGSLIKVRFRLFGAVYSLFLSVLLYAASLVGGGARGVGCAL